MKVKIGLCCLTILLLGGITVYENRSSAQELPTNRLKDPNKVALWSLFVPGGGHFYLGEHKTGSMYLLGELGLYLAGCQIENKLEESEQNIFHIHALKLHELGVFTAYRQARLKYSDDSYSIPIDDTPISSLALAPFKWKNIKSSEVVGAFVAGVIINLIESSESSEHDSGLAFCGVSPLIALSEECLWRGTIQNQLEEGLGKEKGLFLSSLLFGLGHVSQPRELKSWVNGGVAFLFGLYLGRIYQEEGYRMEKSIAAHFWFNVGATVTLLLLDPNSDKSLFFKVGFTF